MYEALERLRFLADFKALDHFNSTLFKDRRKSWKEFESITERLKVRP